MGRLVTGVDLWLRMRDLRNQNAHDYLPEHLLRIYSAIAGEFGPELLRLGQHVETTPSAIAGTASDDAL